MAVGLEHLRPRCAHRGTGKPGAELDAGDQLPVGADVEAELPAVINVEVSHDLRETPDGAAGLQGERLVHRQVMNERGLAERRPRAGRVG